MACLVCGSESTIKAHLIPKAFVNEIKEFNSENHLIARGKSRPTRSRSGRFDDSILCSACDQTIGNFENDVFNMLKEARQSLCRVDLSKATLPVLTYNKISGNEVIRFAAGIIWKYAVSSISGNGIDLGPYTPVLKSIAFENAEIPSAVNLLVFLLDGNSSDSYFYREPLLDRFDEVNVVRFSVGRCVCFLKVDKRPPSASPFSQFWLRNKNSVNLIVTPARTFEETEMVKKLTLRSDFQNYNLNGNFK